jgi:hypothetical protein
LGNPVEIGTKANALRQGLRALPCSLSVRPWLAVSALPFPFFFENDLVALVLGIPKGLCSYHFLLASGIYDEPISDELARQHLVLTSKPIFIFANIFQVAIPMNSI